MRYADQVGASLFPQSVLFYMGARETEVHLLLLATLQVRTGL